MLLPTDPLFPRYEAHRSRSQHASPSRLRPRSAPVPPTTGPGAHFCRNAAAGGRSPDTLAALARWEDTCWPRPVADSSSESRLSTVLCWDGIDASDTFALREGREASNRGVQGACGRLKQIAGPT